MSGAGLYDPTSIMNADTLNKCQREGWVKLAFYLLSFFYYLYGSAPLAKLAKKINIVNFLCFQDDIFSHLHLCLNAEFMKKKCRTINCYVRMRFRTR